MEIGFALQLAETNFEQWLRVIFMGKLFFDFRKQNLLD